MPIIKGQHPDGILRIFQRKVVISKLSSATDVFTWPTSPHVKNLGSKRLLARCFHGDVKRKRPLEAVVVKCLDETSDHKVVLIRRPMKPLSSANNHFFITHPNRPDSGANNPAQPLIVSYDLHVFLMKLFSLFGFNSDKHIQKRCELFVLPGKAVVAS